MAVEQQSEQSASGIAPTRTAPTSLWRHRDFLLLWAGESVSALGSQITLFALPVAAVLILHASGSQLGILKFLYTVPYLVVPLAVGVWLDRRPRQPAMLLANLSRAALVASIPVAGWLGGLTLTQIYIVALLGGALGVVFDVAYGSFVPHLVGRDRLGSANSRLQGSASVATLAGPGVAGALVGLVGAATTLLADAVSYLISAATIASMRTAEPTPVGSPDRRYVKEVREGLAALFGNPSLRLIAIHAAVYNSVFQLIEIAFIVYALTDRGLSATAFGLVVTIGGVGGLAGVVSAAWLMRRLGAGPALILALTLSTNAFWVLPLAHGSTAAVAISFGAAFFVGGAGIGVANVVVSTIRQSLTPDRVMARVNASYRVMNAGAIPVGSAVAAVLITIWSAHTLLWIAPIGLMASAIPALLPALRRLHTLPTTPPDA